MDLPEPTVTAARDADASGSRRRSPDAVAGAAPASVRAAQVRSVGGAFLRARPLVVAPVALANAALVASSDAPAAQRAWLVAALGSALALFAAERWWLWRRAAVDERWLAASLAATAGLLALACALSGGVASPFVPLLLAPAVVTASAFGRTRTTVLALAWSFALVVALAVVPAGWPFPAIAAPQGLAMTAVSFAGLLALSYAGVAGLVDAYARAADALAHLRVEAMTEAASRIRATEAGAAKVAHEIKNPLAAIKALLQLQRGKLDERGAQRLAVVLGEVDRIDAIVRDYLAFARPLSALAPAPFDLGALAAEVVAVLAARAELAGVALAATGRAPVVADARRVREVLFNLADNALAATPRGGRVTLEVSADGAAARVVVEDTGEGLAPALAAAPPFTTTRATGTGLGLAIARAAVAQHGGALVLAPRPGGGTRATVTLPLSSASGAVDREGAAP